MKWCTTTIKTKEFLPTADEGTQVITVWYADGIEKATRLRLAARTCMRQERRGLTLVMLAWTAITRWTAAVKSGNKLTNKTLIGNQFRQTRLKCNRMQNNTPAIANFNSKYRCPILNINSKTISRASGTSRTSSKLTRVRDHSKAFWKIDKTVNLIVCLPSTQIQGTENSILIIVHVSAGLNTSTRSTSSR